jgi:glucan 1,3-beta-glucosidase
VLIGYEDDVVLTSKQYTSGNSNQQHERAAFVQTPRTESLLSAGRYFSMAPPTYLEYSVDQFVNIKSVPGLPVYGDGSHDDTANINTILKEYAGCKLIYFPAGTYIVTNTVFVPPNSRIFGDAYGTAISAVGSNFYNPNAPTTMFQVGNNGDVGVAQISDMLFTVADVLQGCKLASACPSIWSLTELTIPGRSKHRRLQAWRCRILE